MKLATICSLILLVSCVAIGIWAGCFQRHAHGGVVVGNKELCAVWDGGNLLIGLFEPEPPLPDSLGNKHWPPLPSYVISVWPACIISLVLPIISILRARSRRRGFLVRPTGCRSLILSSMHGNNHH